MTDQGSRVAAFTLLEVLIAVFVLGTMLTSLLSLVSGNLARLGDARGELREARLAETRVRDLEARAERGELLREGVESGRYEAPDDDLAWQVSVEPYRVPAPPDVAPLSPLFETRDPRAPFAARRVEVRIFPAEGLPESARPFVILLVEPRADADAAEDGDPS